jgi:hypothetical protein
MVGRFTPEQNCGDCTFPGDKLWSLAGQGRFNAGSFDDPVEAGPSGRAGVALSFLPVIESLNFRKPLCQPGLLR